MKHLPIGQNKINKNFSPTFETFTGTILIFSNIAPIKSFADVSQNMNSIASSLFHIIKHVEDILEQRKLLPRCYSAVFIGLLFFVMPTNFAPNALDVNKQVVFPNVT